MKTPPWARLEEVWGTTDNLRHPQVADAAFTADGKTLVTVGNRGQLRVWDLATRALRTVLDACVPSRAPRDPYGPGGHALAISPDGLVAVGFAGGRICVADLSTGALVQNIEAHAAHVVGIAFAGGLLVSYGYQETIGEEASTRYLIVQREAGGEVRWWDSRTGVRVAEVVVGPQQAIRFFPDGNRLVTVGEELGVWQRNGRKVWHHAAHVAALAILPDGQLLVAAREGGLLGFSAETGERTGTFETTGGLPEKYKAVAATADGRFAATLTETGPKLVLWDLRTRREIGRRITGAAHRRIAPDTLAFSPDGSMLVSWNSDGPAVWSTRTLEPYWSSAPGALEGGTLSRDGRRVLTCAGSVARLWDLATGQTIAGWSIRDGGGALLMPDGKRFLESYYDASQMRDVQTGAVVWVMDRRAPMGHLLVSPDGSRIASLGALFEGTRLHDAASGEVIWHDPGAEPLAFSADGKTLYARTRDWHLLALDTVDGTVRSQIDRQRTETTAFYPSPDGKRALAAHYDHLTAYDLESGQQLWHLEKANSAYDYTILPGSSAFVTYGQAIHLRSMATGLDLGPPLSLDEMPSAPYRFIVSDDGKTLLLGSSEGLIYRFVLDPSAR